MAGCGCRIVLIAAVFEHPLLSCAAVQTRRGHHETIPFAQVELRGLRDGVMKEAPLAAAAPDREDAAAGTTITADGDADDDWGGGDDMDDDELVALQAEEWVRTLRRNLRTYFISLMCSSFVGLQSAAAAQWRRPLHLAWRCRARICGSHLQSLTSLEAGRRCLTTWSAGRHQFNYA